MIIKKCLNCNKKFEVENYRKDKAKFCSYKCYWKYIEKGNYKNCGFRRGHKSFVTPEAIKKIKEKMKGRKPKNLDWLHNSLEVNEKRKKALKGKQNSLGYKMTDEQKKALSNRNKRLGIEPPHHWGKEHWNWKGGITPLKIEIRKLARYHKWVLETYKNDSFKCQKCFKVGKELDAHHIKSFATVLRENNIKTTKQSMMCKDLWERGITLCKQCHQSFHSIYGKIANRRGLDIFLESNLESYDIEREKNL